MSLSLIIVILVGANDDPIIQSCLTLCLDILFVRRRGSPDWV